MPEYLDNTNVSVIDKRGAIRPTEPTLKRHTPSAAVSESEEECFLEPMGSRMIVIEDDFFYKGAIIIPDNAKQRTTTGRVVAIGPEVDTTVYAVGDRILYAQFSGTGVHFQNRPAYRVLGQDEILCKIRTDDEILEGTTA